MKRLKVLVACEESQEVCKAFRARGHEAYSCDIQPCSGFKPEWHIQDDAVQVAYFGTWDLMIAHPPCTYMSAAGARWMYAGGKLNEDRLSKALKAKELFDAMLHAPIEKIAVENPKPLTIVGLPTPSQEIQPFWFGHPYTKKTFLWLKGLPKLVETDRVKDPKPFLQSGAKNAETSRVRGAARSRTFPGIAQAMASQWSEDLTPS